MRSVSLKPRCHFTLCVGRPTLSQPALAYRRSVRRASIFAKCSGIDTSNGKLHFSLERLQEFVMSRALFTSKFAKGAWRLLGGKPQASATLVETSANYYRNASTPRRLPASIYRYVHLSSNVIVARDESSWIKPAWTPSGIL